MFKREITWYAFGTTVFTPFCLLVPYGYSIGTINAAAIPIRNFYNQSFTISRGAPLDDGTLNLLWALTISMFPIGGMIGSLFVRQLVASFGRRNTLIYIQLICVFASFLMGISVVVNSFECIVVGRMILGFQSAVATGIGPMYVSEVMPSHSSGPAGSLFTVAITTGIVLGNSLGLEQVLGSTSGWPYLLAITGVPAVIYLLYSPLLPKSPRELFLDKSNPVEATKVLQRLRGVDDVSSEILALQEQAKKASDIKVMSIKQVITSRRVRWQLVSTIVIMSAYQLSGINAIQFFLSEVFSLAGIARAAIPYVSIGVLIGQVLISFCSGFLMERFGRKTVLLCGNGTIAICMIVYTISSGLNTTVSWFPYVGVVAAVGFIYGFVVGPSPVIYIIVPELLDQSSRPAAITIGVFCLWTSFAIVGFISQYLFVYLTFAAFLPFLTLTIGIMAFVYFIVPETKGKSILAIQAIFAKRNKVPFTVDTEL